MSVIISTYFTGSLLQCSKAADRLTKKTVNPEIESDYERTCNDNQLIKNSKKLLLSFHFYDVSLL